MILQRLIFLFQDVLLLTEKLHTFEKGLQDFPGKNRYKALV
jgi:hypothetical protein